MEKFFEYCALAGPESCPMWVGHDTSDTRQRLLDIYDDLRTNGPIAVPGTPTTDPDIVTLSDVKRSVFNMLYAPLTRWPVYAGLLAPLTDRNGTAFAADNQLSSRETWASLPSSFGLEDPSASPGAGSQGFLAGRLILGGNVSSRLNQEAFALKCWLPLGMTSFCDRDIGCIYIFLAHAYFHSMPSLMRYLTGSV